MADYTIKYGDTLYDIAKKTGNSLEEILDMNPNLKQNPDYIIPGQKIIIQNPKQKPNPKKWINSIHEKALAYPEWFWGDSEDAKEARAWFYKEGNKQFMPIVDEIWEYTPKELKEKVDYKKLPTHIQQQKFNKGITDTTDKAAKVIAGTAGTLVGTAALAAPITETIIAAPVKFIGGLIGGVTGSEISNWVSRKWTGKSFDYHSGKAASRIADAITRNIPSGGEAYAPWNGYIIGQTKDGKPIYEAPNQEHFEKVGAWINPFTWAGGGAGTKFAPAIVKGGQTTITATGNIVNDAIIKKAVKTGKISFVEKPTTYKVVHQSERPVYKPKFPFNEKQGVINHGADPNGIYFTLDQPTVEGFTPKRKFISNWDVTSNKTLVQNGELKSLLKKNNIRNRVIRFAKKNGADAILFDDIADNQLQHQKVLFATDKAGISLMDHNYYDKLKPLSDLDRNKIITANDLKTTFQKVYRKVPKELTEYLRDVVNEEGVINLNQLKQGNTELYRLFDKINMPYRKMEDVTGQRFFTKGRVLRTGNLYDHALGVAESAKLTPLPYSKTKSITQQKMVLADLYHDQGKLIPYIMDNVNKHKFPMHDEYGYYMGKIYGLDMKGRNAVRGHMSSSSKKVRFKNPFAAAMQAHDRLTGATSEEGKKFVRNWRKWIPYRDENYKPSSIFKNNLKDLETASNLENSKIYSPMSIKSMNRGIIQNEVVARNLQNLDASKEIAEAAEIVKQLDPKAYKEVIEKTENPFKLNKVGKLYKDLDGNFIDKISQLRNAKKQFSEAGLPILNGSYYGNIKDFSTMIAAERRGLIPTTRWVAGTDSGKQVLFTGGDPQGFAISYALKTKNPIQVKKGSYSGKLSLAEAKIPVSKEMQSNLIKSYTDFMESAKRIKNGTSTNMAEDLEIMLKNYPTLQNSTLMADVMRGTNAGQYITSFQKKSVQDLSKYAESKINYPKEVDKISFTDPRTEMLYKSKPIETEGGRVTNQMVRYFVKDDSNILDLAQMKNYGLFKYTDLNSRKSLLYSIYNKRDEYPHLWDYLNRTGRISTDGIQKAAAIDNPNVVIRARVNDFGGRTVDGQYPIELILNGNNVLTDKQINAQTQEKINQIIENFKKSISKVNLIDVAPSVGGVALSSN